jgi:hypothetical protein
VSGGSTWLTFTGNTIVHNAASYDNATLLYANAAAYSTFTGNSLEPNHHGTETLPVVLIGGTAETFAGNSITEFNQGGTATAYLLKLVTSCTSCTVSGNTFASAAGDVCLDINGGTVISVTGNVFQTCTKAIVFDGASAGSTTIIGNTLTSVTTPFTYTTIPTGPVVIRDNAGYNPIGSPANCIDISNNIAPWGTTGTCAFTLVTASTYTVKGSDASINFVNFGTGAGNISWNTNIGAGPFTIACASALPTLNDFFLPIGSTITSNCATKQPQINIGFQ